MKFAPAALKCTKCTPTALHFYAHGAKMYAHGAIKHAHGAKIYLTALEGAEIIPGKRKRSDTRIKPLTLTNGHGRYITVTPERTLFSVEEWPLNI